MNIQYNLLPDSERHQFKHQQQFPFGKFRTDHMFLMDYSPDEHWHNPRIVPYQQGLNLPLGAKVINYGQGIFEGEKVYQHDDGQIYLFRPDLNIRRLNQSAQRISIPEIDPEKQLEARLALVDVDRRCFPQQEGISMYMRPVIIGISDTLGLESSEDFVFGIFLSPTSSYFKSNLLTILLTDKFHRAVPGGTGNVKYIGNYASTFHQGNIARSIGADQILYLDVTNTFLEEYGAMNHFQVTRNGEIQIPLFTDTILHSTTAQTMLDLAPQLSRSVTVETIAVAEFIEDINSGQITETGGLGTAAVVAPVGKYLLDLGSNANYKNLKRLVVNDGQTGEVTREMHALLTNVQKGRIEAPKGWLVRVPSNS